MKKRLIVACGSGVATSQTIASKIANMFENDGISLEVFSKQEDNGNQSYIVYFYYENEKYAVAGINDREFLKEIAVKYQEAIVDNY